MKSGNNFSLTYKKEIAKVEKILNGLLSNRKPRSIYEPCDYVIKGGGKRLRPLLVLLSARSVNGKFSNVYNAAAAVELLHNFTLVHDDIMDNSDKRRGRQTLHKKHDLSTAILAGDSLNALAYECLLNDCNHNSKEVISYFTNGIVEVCEGQSLDKMFEIKKNVSIEEYKIMIYKKTAALAETCCVIGGVLGGGNKTQIKILADYGKNLGMAFQIQDDLLDITAKEHEFGKPVGGDLIEGKKTYLFLKTIEKATGKNRKLLLDVIKNKGIEKKDLRLYKTLYEELGVLNDAKDEIIKYTNRALKNLIKLPNQEGRLMLTWLANTLINRSK